jgi:hypothetical protein
MGDVRLTVEDSANTTTGAPQSVKGLNNAAWQYLASLIAGENQPLGLTETSLPGAYVSGSAVTSGADIVLGFPGGAGNKLYAISVFNGSASAFTACVIKDGSTVVDWLTLGMTILAPGGFATWVPAGGVLESQNGSWKLVITCAGVMNTIKYGAVVAQGV